MKLPLLLILSFFVPLGTEPTPLLIMKTNQSGSSWFHSLLNRLEGVYITLEILKDTGRKKREKLGGEMTAYICDSLKHPMMIWPAGEDRTQRNKTFFIVGSTINPSKAFINLDEIARQVPSLRVVA